NFAVAHRPQEIHHRQHVPHSQNGGPRGRENVQHLELGRVLPIAAWHSQITEHELREESQVESHEDDERSQLAPGFGIHASGDLRPPEVQTADVGHHHASDHDVVEVRDDEIGVGHMYIDT